MKSWCPPSGTPSLGTHVCDHYSTLLLYVFIVSWSMLDSLGMQVSQLRQYRPRASTRSPFFWGDFEVMTPSSILPLVFPNTKPIYNGYPLSADPSIGRGSTFGGKPRLKLLTQEELERPVGFAQNLCMHPFRSFFFLHKPVA
jgi:hypothetical protein